MELFLSDPHLIFNGYQTNLGNLDEGVFFFTHIEDYCGSTIGLKVRSFASLYCGPRYSGNKQLSSACPRYCLDKNNLNRCSAQCENAFAREVSQIIKDTMAIHREAGCIRPSCKTVPRVLELR